MIQVLLLFLLSVSAALGGEEPATRSWDGNYLPAFERPAEKQPELMGALFKSPVPSPDTARKIAQDYWLQHQGFLAEEMLHVQGLYRLSREMEGFASRGDWVWEVRVLHIDAGLDGIVWINAQSKKVYAFGPRKEP